jgi:uncharacterized lipoprotein YddW (UPF0748 family)
MREFVAVLVIAGVFLCAACSARQVNPESSSEPVVISQSSDSSSYPAEMPPADASLPISSDASSSEKEQSSSVSSASSLEAASGSSAAASGAATVSSSVAAAVGSSAAASSSAASSSSSSSESVAPAPSPSAQGEETRAVWISYLEFLNLAQNKTKAEFTANMRLVFSTAASYGLNAVVVHVRPFGDALYDSELFPWSYVLTGTEGQDPGYDPLAIMVQEAHQQGLFFEAWINPYRIRAGSSDKALSRGTPARDCIGTDRVIAYNGGYYYNPADAQARRLIIDGVLEIMENYAVDGIHFDDYFYPTTDAAFDAEDYQTYKASGGSMSLADWRRHNVDILIWDVYHAIKSADSSVLFGISPQANMNNNYNAQFIDVEKWVNDGGYVDYLCPQVYFGFDNGSLPYADTVKAWSDLVRGSDVDLLIGLAAYKCGAADSYAGAGKAEWENNTDLLQRMVVYARKQSAYAGFTLYRYESLFSPAAAVASHVAAERANLQSILD